MPESLKMKNKVVSFDNVRVTFSITDMVNSAPVFISEKFPTFHENVLSFIVKEKLEVETVIEIEIIENTIKKNRGKGKGSKALSKFIKKYVNEHTLVILEAGILVSQNNDPASEEKESSILAKLSSFYKRNNFQQIYNFKSSNLIRIPFVFDNEAGKYLINADIETLKEDAS